MEFNLENPLTSSQELNLESVPSLFLAESGHMPSRDYLATVKAVDLDVSFRAESISLILPMCHGYDPFVSYLAINYLDRFLSSQGIPQLKPWVLRLLAVTFVSLAAKMTKTEFFLADIQGDGGIVFEAETVQRMEVVVLGALKWRMRSITPFSFLHFFISSFNLKDPPLRQVLKSRATDIIIKAQHDINVLEFKPSIVAAAALLCASHELFPLQFRCFRKSISNCSFVNTGNMTECYNAMQAMAAMEGYESVLDTANSCSDTPVNVLDHRALSSESETTDGAISSTTNRSTPRTGNNIKRRRLGGYCGNQTADDQLSHVQH